MPKKPTTKKPTTRKPTTIQTSELTSIRTRSRLSFWSMPT